MKSAEKQAIALQSLAAVTSDLRPITRPVHGWIRAIRQALGLSRATVSSRLKLSPQAIQSYEKAEQNDAITLASLRRAAGALDCELVIAFLPTKGRTFAELAAAHDPARAHLRATEHSMALENQASGDLPRD